jgi:addiction module HigA family antidote
MAVLHRIKSRIDNKLVHPGVILLEEFLRPFDISQNALARLRGVPPRRINEIVLGKRAITVDTALGLSDVLGLSAQYWMALQADYDIETARMHRPSRDPRLAPRMKYAEYASDPFDDPTPEPFEEYRVGRPKPAMTRGVMNVRNSRGTKR